MMEEAGRRQRAVPVIFDGTEDGENIFERLNTLEVFPPLPMKNHVTLCEINAEFQVALSPGPEHAPGANVFTPLAAQYILINEEVLKPAVTKKIPSIRTGSDDDGFLISTPETSALKSAWNGWQDNGINGVIKGLRKASAPPVIINTIATVMKFQRNVTDLRKYAHAYFYPHLALESEDLIQYFAPVRHWKKAWVKAMCWHPNYSTLALALNDDTVRVISHDHNVISFLKYVDQKLVTSMCWRPYGSELAIGVQAGLLIWHVKSVSIPAASCAKLHTVPGHYPVTSVDYNEHGEKLVSSSAADNCLVIWNTDSWIPTPLMRIGGAGIPRAKWSSGLNANLFCNTPTSLFRIWTFQNDLKSKKWNTKREPVEAFTWSPCGTMAIFVSDCIIYSISLRPFEIELISQKMEPIITPLFNVKVCTVRQTGSEMKYKAGGKVLQLELDPTGSRLAVLFSDSELIPVFRVEKKSNTFLIPLGFVRGHQNELPIAISFQKNFKEGALLSVAWSSHRIQYFPMLFAGSSRLSTMLNEEPQYYIKYQNLNLTGMSGQTPATSRVPVDFGSFSQYSQSQNNVAQSGPHGDLLANLEGSPIRPNPKLYSL